MSHYIHKYIFDTDPLPSLTSAYVIYEWSLRREIGELPMSEASVIQIFSHCPRMTFGMHSQSIQKPGKGNYVNYDKTIVNVMIMFAQVRFMNTSFDNY